MDRVELEELLRQIRVEKREEDASTEWKRCWYNFKIEDGKDEFVRDVTALANARTNSKARRVIVFGIKLGGSTQNAELPEDEAGLQERLKRISPPLKISFKNVRMDDSTMLSVAEVHEPFDPPYVAKIGPDYFVYVRAGSSRTTAARSDFETWRKAWTASSDLALFLGTTAVVNEKVYTLKREIRRPPTRPRRSASLDPGMFQARVERWKSEVLKVETANRELSLPFAVLNVGSGASESIKADFVIEGITKLNLSKDSLYPQGWPQTPWAVDRNENCFVEQCHFFKDDSAGEAVQRVKLVNPGAREPLRELWMLGSLAGGEPADTPFRVSVSYDVTDRGGSRVQGRFYVQVDFIDPP